jgi:putative hemolysin
MKQILIMMLLLGIVLMTACARESKEINTNVDDGAKIANPASEFCVSHGGTLDIRTAGDGSQSGFCIINGKECEEWSLMRAECSNIHICTIEEKNAEICTMDYMPVCGSDGQTHGNGCGACSAGVDLWVAGECPAAR